MWSVQFAGKRLTVEYHNPKKLDAGAYAIREVFMDGQPLDLIRWPRIKFASKEHPSPKMPSSKLFWGFDIGRDTHYYAILGHAKIYR